MNVHKKKKGLSGQFIGGLFLVTGTCIGGGMLGLPVATGEAGFFPSLLVYLMAWGTMTTTGLLMLEVLIAIKKRANLVSMASVTLGRSGEFVAWILYLFLFFSLTVAYSKAIVDLVANFLPRSYAVLVFLVFLIGSIQLGTRFVARFNSMLVLGLFISYGMLVVLGLPQIELTKLARADWAASFTTLPLVITAFGFQGVVPIVYHYFSGEYRQIRAAIIVGSLVALVIYVGWQMLVLGIVPVDGPGGLAAARDHDQLATISLHRHLNDMRITAIGQGLSFFAIASSLLGVGIGLVDFLLDGLNVKRVWKNRFIISCLTFTPATLIAMQGGAVFYGALTYGGGIGCTLLLGALPVAMVLVLRHSRRFSYCCHVASSYWVLAPVTFVICLVIVSVFCQWVLA